MSKRITAVAAVLFAASAVVVAGLLHSSLKAAAGAATELSAFDPQADRVAAGNGFAVEVLIEGRPAIEYIARGRRYIEAFENAEYELRIHNPTGTRVAVALSVDGLNTVDARHTSAWEARKWVVAPYGTIHVRGWQMSSENARRFYFTTERQSYASRLGQAANLGVISAVFFRERGPITIMPVTPGPLRKSEREERSSDLRVENAPSTAGEANRDAAKQKSYPGYPPPDDESAATGIGRYVPNGVQWIRMDLEPKPVGEVSIRYEYRSALVRLGIVPRDYPRPGVLERRERAKGFEPGYCPEP